MTLKQMLVEMLNRKSSDLHIRVGIRPHLRVNGRLEQISTDPITIDQMEQVVNQILNETQREKFYSKNEMDLALSVAKLGRFRINLFRQRGTTGIAIRAVNTTVPSYLISINSFLSITTIKAKLVLLSILSELS